MSDVKKILKPILIYSKCMLLTPIFNNYPSINIILLSLLLIIELSSYFIVTSCYFFLYSSPLVTVVTLTNFFLAISCTVTILVSACINNTKFDLIVTKLISIDEQFKWECYNNTKRHLRWCLITWWIYIFLTVFGVVMNQFNPVNENMPLLFYVVYNFAFVLAGSLVIIYTTFVQIVEERFQHIGVTIKELETVNEPKSILSGLRHMGLLHLETCELLTMINEYFSDSVFSIVAMFFVHILTNLYMIGVLQKCVGSTNAGNVVLVFSIIQGVPGVLVIFVLCYRCNKTIHFGMKIGEYVHGLSLFSEQMINATRVFSLQILNSDMKFTAADIFDLDFKLVFGIIGSLTTYLIILVQFSSEDNLVCDDWKDAVTSLTDN